MNRPCPTPAKHRPMNNWGNLFAEQAMAEPAAETSPPRAMVCVREILSDKGPAIMDERDAVRRMQETINPWTVGVTLRP